MDWMKRLCEACLWEQQRFFILTATNTDLKVGSVVDVTKSGWCSWRFNNRYSFIFWIGLYIILIYVIFYAPSSLFTNSLQTCPLFHIQCRLNVGKVQSWNFTPEWQGDFTSQKQWTLFKPAVTKEKNTQIQSNQARPVWTAYRDFQSATTGCKDWSRGKKRSWGRELCAYLCVFEHSSLWKGRFT